MFKIELKLGKAKKMPKFFLHRGIVKTFKTCLFQLNSLK